MSNIEWLVVGGRRWARIIANELGGMLAPTNTVALLSDSRDMDLLDYWKSNPYKERLKIVEQIEACRPPKIGVAIIANSAYLHRSSIEMALDAGYNIISEKPLTLSVAESNALLEKGRKLGLKLFSTNTYLFADYLRVFRRDYLSGQKISKLDIQWVDPIVESRHGERKRYDSTIPIIYDLLPHIASIVLATYGGVNLRKSDITVSKGGSEVALRVVCEDLNITITLARNSLLRKRFIRFSGITLDVALDFTEEPGLVFAAGQSPVISDLDWISKRKPLAEMLYCAKSYFEGGTIDNRLSIHSALLGNKLIDLVEKDYVEQQMSFLSLEKDAKFTQDLHFFYAKKESTSLNKRALPYLSNKTFLRRLALASQQRYQTKINKTEEFK